MVENSLRFNHSAVILLFSAKDLFLLMKNKTLFFAHLSSVIAWAGLGGSRAYPWNAGRNAVDNLGAVQSSLWNVFGRWEETGALWRNPHAKLHVDSNLSSGVKRGRWSCDAAARHAAQPCYNLKKMRENHFDACIMVAGGMFYVFYY